MRDTPLSVLICEDDDYARQGLYNLFTRDVRTRVVCAVETPEGLLRVANRLRLPPDGVVIDVDYRKGPSLTSVVEELNAIRTGIPVVCISEYGEIDGDKVQEALQGGVNGFVDKDDVRFAIVTAVVQALETTFVYSPTIEPWLKKWGAGSKCQPRHRIETWRLHPEFKPRHHPVIFQAILHQMSARLVALEVQTEDGITRWKEDSVVRFRDEVYDILAGDNGGFYDLTYLEPVLEMVAPKNTGADVRVSKTKQGNMVKSGRPRRVGLEAAFHILTQPPTRDHPAYTRRSDSPPVSDAVCV